MWRVEVTCSLVANYAYLCVSEQETVYPAFAVATYEPAMSTVASCAWNVPLLWFAMFRPVDLVTRTFQTDDGPYVVTAPITPRKLAMGRLVESLPRLQVLFGQQGDITEYCALLAQAVRDVPGQYITIEWDEIDVITEGSFLAEAAAAMASLDPATTSNPELDRRRLQRLSGLGVAERKLPPARYLLDRMTGTGEDEYLHARIVGSRHLRQVPWEPPVDDDAVQSPFTPGGDRW